MGLVLASCLSTTALNFTPLKQLTCWPSKKDVWKRILLRSSASVQNSAPLERFPQISSHSEMNTKPLYTTWLCLTNFFIDEYILTHWHKSKCNKIKLFKLRYSSSTNTRGVVSVWPFSLVQPSPDLANAIFPLCLISLFCSCRVTCCIPQGSI